MTDIAPQLKTTEARRDNDALQPDADTAVVALENVVKQYGTGHQRINALAGIDLTLHRGQFVAVMGASGSGKSTLLHVIGGLEPPTSGRVSIEGRDLATMSDRQRTLFRRRRLGVIFQSFNLLPTLTARENVGLPMLVDGARRTDIEKRTDELLTLVDLNARAEHRPSAMSGGEQQRVAVARALLNDPALVLADEPTGNLDSHHAEDIWRLLRKLAIELQRTVLMVTHEAQGAAFADRVLVLKDGLLVGEFSTPEEPDAALVAARYQELAR